MFFANEQRDNVRSENPGIAFGTPATTSIALQQMLTMLQARLARSLVSAGRTCPPSSAPRMRPRLLRTRSVMSKRRPLTLRYDVLISGANAKLTHKTGAEQ